LESEPGQLAGYGLLRPGARALYLGPVVTRSTPLALRLLGALLEHSNGDTVFWDIPDQNTSAVEWAKQQGFTPQRSLTRMYLGQNTAPGDAQKQIALAGPEIG
jgi:hypothetical protein